MSGRRDGFLIRASLHRPVTMLMLLVTLGVVGVIAYRKIPLQLVPPGVSDNDITIYIPVPDSTPAEVMERVAIPAEELLRTIPGIRNISSRSRASSCAIEVAYGTDQDGAAIYADVRDRMERLLPSLPEGAERYHLFRFNLETDLPVMMLAVSFEDDVKNPDALVENVVQQRLKAVDGVARVDVDGLLDREVEIGLDPDAVHAYRIDVKGLIQRLWSDNMIAPGGVMLEGGRRYLLRLSSKFSSFNEIRGYPIDRSLTLGDVAKVDYHSALRSYLARVDGRLCRLIHISRESEANTVGTCARLEKEIAALRQDPRLAGFTFQPFFSQGRMIESSLGNLEKTSAWGGAFAVLILFLFLRRLGMTFVVAAAIPLSALIAVVVIFFRGGTFNMFSLCGLTLSIGMLIDNAIVIAENIFRHRELGERRLPAATRGVQEVALAVTLATLTTVAVFLPLIFLSSESNLKVILKELGLPVCYSLLASLFVALVFIPIATTFFRDRARPADSTEIAGGPATGRTLSRMAIGYRWLLAWFLRHRFLGIVIFILVLASSWIPSSLMKVQGRGEEGAHQVRLRVECAPHFSLAETDAAIEKIRKACEPLRAELEIDAVACWYRNRGGTVAFFLKPGARITEKRFLKRIRGVLPELPGVRIELGSQGEGDKQKEITVEARGRDPEVLARLLDQVADRLRALPGIIAASVPSDRSDEEVVVNVLRERAQRFGVNPRSVSQLVAWALRGARLPDFQTASEEIPLWIRYAGGDLRGLGDLYRVPVYSETGNEVAISSLADFSMERGLPALYRKDGRVQQSLRLITEENVDEGRLLRRIESEFHSLEVPEGYDLAVGGSATELAKVQRDLSYAGALGLVLIFVLMGVLFESVLLPLSVLLCIPFLWVGAYWLIYILDSPLNEMGMVGIVVLLGIVVNNGIVLIDCINRFRDEHPTRTSAILAAGHARLRPILMTACTTIFGLLPLVLFPQRGEGIDYRPLAVVVMGGLLSATLFTLFAVPLAYTLLEDLRRFLRGALRVGHSR